MLRDIINREAKKWADKGIISSKQRQQIENLYPAQKPNKQKESGIHVSHIMIGLAAVIFSIGVMLFYAANWKGMPPAVKLIHVFLLIIATYGAAYYLLAVKQDYIIIGRVMLIIGMVAYGVGIMLVAQIFHISAHPTNGLLAWAMGVLAISAVTRERFGYFLAMLLFSIWNTWEFSVYNNPNYAYIFVLAVISFLLNKGKERIALIFPLFMLLIWFYQVNIYTIENMDYREYDYAVITFIFSHIPLGVLLTGLSWLLKENKTGTYAMSVINVIGWIFIFAPFLTVSWPITNNDFTLMIKSMPATMAIAYCIYIISASAILFLLQRKQENILLLSGINLYSLVMLFLPIGHISTLMVSTHLGLVVLIGTWLYHTFFVFKTKSIEKVMAFIYTISIIVFKFFGLLGYGIYYENLRVAYFLGFVIFLTICFLINQVVTFHAIKKKLPYPSAVLSIISAVFGFFILFALSFKIKQQQSIFDTRTVVLIMTFLFIGIALALYMYLWKQGSQKHLLILSGIIFAFSTLVLIVSGDKISWIFYSLIFNALLLIYIATLIYYSTKIHSKVLLNFAIAGLILLLITRYFDLFWDMLSGSLLFICTGIVVFAGGWLLERNRRKLAQIIEKTK